MMVFGMVFIEVIMVVGLRIGVVFVFFGLYIVRDIFLYCGLDFDIKIFRGVFGMFLMVFMLIM